MAKVKIYPEQEIMRINRLKERLVQLRSVEFESLIRRPSQKSWSPMEVLSHMIMAHNVYKGKVEATLPRLKAISGSQDFVVSRSIPSFLIKRFPPKNGVIKFKMKTMKKFQPVYSDQQLKQLDTKQLFDEFETSLNELKRWIEEYRTKEVEKIRFNSAIGAMVKFNVAEACEFILCHNERHFQQMDNALKAN